VDGLGHRRGRRGSRVQDPPKVALGSRNFPGNSLGMRRLWFACGCQLSSRTGNSTNQTVQQPTFAVPQPTPTDRHHFFLFHRHLTDILLIHQSNSTRDLSPIAVAFARDLGNQRSWPTTTGEDTLVGAATIRGSVAIVVSGFSVTFRSFGWVWKCVLVDGLRAGRKQTSSLPP
jgi:hypothetical protein